MSRSRAEDPLRAGDQEERELEFFNTTQLDPKTVVSAWETISTLPCTDC